MKLELELNKHYELNDDYKFNDDCAMIKVQHFEFWILA